MAHAPKTREPKASAFLILSEDGEIQEHLGRILLNEAKAAARGASDTHKQSFTVYKAIAKTSFAQVARVEKA